ncbi:MAG: phosphopyruvate hydratase [Candidatus Buchananbacteria bacterium RIFCSPHIGHO2_02_FULL_40_13]|uniref:Enolase n=1 Tax=Candidatus Buchananbacteria bacterium RIFCSPLOWO2_01_FULL_39_33 TaxID=1797543 RepID=A0A1G1YLB5_9BACT|nr:MAG: phosphopyruvate hydratase [Candidatus Buchananbacteria bacterium RIFCSPHIGHO2_01_FULL_40_35]OGY50162.1 MAG: phosphopyruvate hydratase [Candidatus Buchananbacteria bacterium RIFCSPHIGHO2_02_FULL_40_13]OGY53145.1 MAG: phosphopyruvate hydratase [Candidatus Buchananbacteria bacterium RIFCSPLOWO2_01_FULL_39_33]
MSIIRKITAREILDSRGQPTVEVEVVLTSGRQAWASVPSGASIGTHEALELRDQDQRRYWGQGVLKAVDSVNKKIAPKLIGLDPKNQKKIDELMLKLDGTPNKSKLGANAILGVSLAVARVAAIDNSQPLYLYLKKKYWSRGKLSFPVPMMNILNGGVHAGWAVDIQEFMILPKQKNIKEAIRCGAEIFASLKKILKSRGYATTVGDEGGYAPKLPGNEKALAIILQAVTKAGYQTDSQVKLGIDAAASEFYKDGVYAMAADKKKRDVGQMLELYESWLKKYPLESLEDGLAEDDWNSWQKLTKKLGKKITLVGDDLFVTNVKRLKEGIKKQVGNAILIKLNQIGTLTETVNCLKLAQKHNYKVAISHRSGETLDDFIADLAVAASANYLKAGSLARGERIAKYNRLMEIWDEMK